MASAGELAPVVLWSVNEVGPIREGAHERNREPIANRLAQPGLVLHIVSHVRESVALSLPALVGYLFIAAGERDGLEGKELNLLGIVERELDDSPDLFVVDAVDDRGNWHDVYAGAVKVLNSAQLDVKQVSDLSMFICRIADSVKLQICV